jgi:hypothetical protein
MLRRVRPFPTGQAMNLDNLQAYWQLIAQEFANLEGLPPLEGNRLLSARAFDESQPAGIRAYMAARRYLGVARDNHEALLALFKHHGATLWSPWSLLRPTFETSFLAAWILDPEDGRERRARGLRCEIIDLYQRRRHRDEFRAIPQIQQLLSTTAKDPDDGVLTTYRAEAVALGRSFDKLRQPINVIDELPKLGFVKTQREFAPFLRATWRLLSGFEHGYSWALLRGSDLKVHAHVPGGSDVELVIKDEEFVIAAKSTYFLLLAACRLLTRRHLTPSRS